MSRFNNNTYSESNNSYIQDCDDKIRHYNSNISTETSIGTDEAKYRSLARVDKNSTAISTSHGDTYSQSNHDDVSQGDLYNKNMHHHTQKSQVSSQKLSIRRNSFNQKNEPTITAYYGNSSRDSLSMENQLAPKPFYLVRTHFVSMYSLNKIRKEISDCLDSYDELTYEFNKANHKWACAYVFGSKFCKLEIQIYESEENGYIVEANRLTGDAGAFYLVYKDMKSRLDSPSARSSLIARDSTQHINCKSDGSISLDAAVSQDRWSALQNEDKLSDKEIAEYVDPILNMAKSRESFESWLEASRLLCDIIYQETGTTSSHFSELFLHPITATYRNSSQRSLKGDLTNRVLKHIESHGGVEVLAKMILGSCPCTRRNAVLALAKLSLVSQSCQVRIIATASLPTLLANCRDGSYDDAETRRGSAEILANCANTLASMLENYSSPKTHDNNPEIISETFLDSHIESLRQLLSNSGCIVDKKIKCKVDQVKNIFSSNKVIFA